MCVTFYKPKFLNCIFDGRQHVTSQMGFPRLNAAQCSRLLLSVVNVFGYDYDYDYI